MSRPAFGHLLLCLLPAQSKASLTGVSPLLALLRCREDKDVLGVFRKLKVLGVKLKDATGKVIVIPQGSADALPW